MDEKKIVKTSSDVKQFLSPQLNQLDSFDLVKEAIFLWKNKIESPYWVVVVNGETKQCFQLVSNFFFQVLQKYFCDSWIDLVLQILKIQ